MSTAERRRSGADGRLLDFSKVLPTLGWESQGCNIQFANTRPEEAPEQKPPEPLPKAGKAGKAIRESSTHRHPRGCA